MCTFYVTCIPQTSHKRTNIYSLPTLRNFPNTFQLKYSGLVSWHKRNSLAKGQRAISCTNDSNEPPSPPSFKLDSRFTCRSIGSHPLPRPPSADGKSRTTRTNWSVRTLIYCLDNPKAWPPHPAIFLLNKQIIRFKVAATEGFHFDWTRKSVTWFSSTQNSSTSGCPISHRDPSLS